MKKIWKCVIFKCYSSEELITLNTLHEVVPTWYSFHSWVDWSNVDKVSCSRRKHIDAEVRTRDLCIQNRHSNHYTNCSEESCGMGNEKERYSRSIGYSCDEHVQGGKDKSESWNTFLWRVWGKHRSSLQISFITTVVCHCSWCCY